MASWISPKPDLKETFHKVCFFLVRVLGRRLCHIIHFTLVSLSSSFRGGLMLFGRFFFGGGGLLLKLYNV